MEPWDWITLAMGYLPYLDRFYAPADARGAFIAVRDAASRYGAHIMGIPRDKVPVLTKQNGEEALWNPQDAWEPLTALRKQEGAKRAILGFGCTAFLGQEASEQLGNTDAYVVNGLPFGEGELEALIEHYPEGLVTIEDGIIASPGQGLRGFASLVQGVAGGTGYPLAHVGITDPRIAPSHGFEETWEHFGLTVDAVVEAVTAL